VHSTRFNVFHTPKTPSAQARYNAEVNRLIGVLDSILAQSKSGWLVGDKCTYADLMYVPWNEAVEGMIFKEYPDEFDIQKYPHYKKWDERMRERPAVKKVMGLMEGVRTDVYAEKHS
jgi:glutathione S-transferase